MKRHRATSVVRARVVIIGFAFSLMLAKLVQDSVTYSAYTDAGR